MSARAVGGDEVEGWGEGGLSFSLPTRQLALEETVLATYAERVVDAPEDLLDRARAADLIALVELASRAGQSPVADRAHDQLLAIARTRSLHATASS